MAEFIDSKNAKSYTGTPLRTERGPADTSENESLTSTGQSVEFSNVMPAGSEFNRLEYFDKDEDEGEEEAQLCIFHPGLTNLVISPSIKDEYLCGDCYIKGKIDQRTIAVKEDATHGEYLLKGAYKDHHIYTFPYGPALPPFPFDDKAHKKFYEHLRKPIDLPLEPKVIRSFQELLVREPNFYLHKLQFKINCTECKEDFEGCICKET